MVKRSCEADSWSRMRLASVMLVIEVIQPVCLPRASISGETYMRASNSDAVLAHHAHLDAAGRAAALQLLLQQARVLLHAIGRPVREGRQAADQLGLGEAGHRAEGRVDVGDAALAGPCARMPVSMEFSIARRKLVSCTSALWICARRRMWRQVPSSIHTVSARQRQHHPEQRVADQADRGAVACAAQHHAVGRRRERHVVHDRRAGVLAAAGQRDHACWRARGRFVEHRHRVPALPLPAARSSAAGPRPSTRRSARRRTRCASSSGTCSLEHRGAASRR